MKPKVEDGKDGKVEDVKEKIKFEDAKEKGDSDQEMLNLENEIYSLTHYADDEEELVAQMFATIKGSKLEAMMPPILKEIPLIDVQQLCLHELRGMSQRRILSIINGQEMSGSSSEDSDEDKKPSKMQDENDDSNMGGKSIDDGDDLLTGKDLTELENVNESNLTALDILELEMRAKLIKTMLEKQDGEDSKEEGTNGLYDPNIKIKLEPLTPESNRGEEDAPLESSDTRHKSKYSRSRRRRRRRSDSRNYSSSRSSYSSSRSRSYSRSNCSSSDRKRGVSESPESKKISKKKITKKEFEARMKKAKMNRSYRKRKESEEDSGDNAKKGKRKPKKKGESVDKVEDEVPETADAVPPEGENPSQEKEEGAEEQQVEEGEVEEKEEGEIDSNEEGACSSGSRSSRSRSRSYSSYSSYYSRSSRSRSYSRSPRRSRKKSKKSKSKKKYRRSRSRSSSDVPKVPNWKPEKSNKTAAESKPDISEESSKALTEPKKTLPLKDERESISFSFNKKNSGPVKASSELNAGGLPRIAQQEEERVEEGDGNDTNLQSEIIMETESEEKVISIEEEEEESHTPPPRSIPKDAKDKPAEDVEPGEVVEDFYKGADQLSFSEEEGECEDEADLEKFLHDDTPVEPISVGDSILRKSVNVVSNKDEPPIVSWENKKKKERKGDMVLEGLGFLKTVLTEGQSNADSPMEEDGSLPDGGEDSSQNVLEPLPETEAEDSRDSHNLEIIGVIDPTDNQEETFDEELAAGGSSWSMRWLQSEKVQKVVSNSTLLSKVRKKIQAKGKGKGIIKEAPKPVPKPQVAEVKSEPPKIEAKPQQAKSSNVIGSIEEYEKLFGIKVKAPTSLPQPKPQSKAVSQAVSLLDSGDDEDSEEEAIWSKIIKK